MSIVARLDYIGKLLVQVAVRVRRLPASPGVTVFDWLDDDDENEEADVEEGDDDDNSDAAVEKSFREQRALVLGSKDLGDLRRSRRNLQTALDNESMHGLVAARARDLVELIDDRIATLRAKQMTDGR